MSARVPLRSALAIVSAAYEEAMREHGLLPDTITVISAMAARHLETLEAEDRSEDRGARPPDGGT
ncbi:hypothetical protein [Actinomadura kijaniata]|uniref:hypothetical protein n=1 Tax=Actinomadura kijaniata TaxID=46161 RepID=UPI00082EFD8E|nr:hypothetical protein [Actinomadura kijaniata]